MPKELERKLKADIAYLAGIIDGEGCIGIYTRNPRNGRSIQHQLQMQVNMQTKQAIDFLYFTFGGLKNYRVKNKKTNAYCYQWRVSNRKAYNTIQTLLPYIRVKKTEALVAIDFFKNCIGLSGAGKLSQEEIDKRQEFKIKLQNLKKSQYTYA